MPPTERCARFHPTGTPARVTQTRRQAGQVNVDGVLISINRNTHGAVENLPEPTEGARYMVSVLAAQAAKGREDLLMVDDTARATWQPHHRLPGTGRSRVGSLL